MVAIEQIIKAELRLQCAGCAVARLHLEAGAFRAGRFANNEPSVHAFDLMCADRYLGDAFVSARTVRDDYGLSPTG